MSGGMTTLTNHCQQLHAQGKSQEEIISFLRSQGRSKVESTVVIAKALGMDLRKAKAVVHMSNTWADARGRDEQFHESLQRHLKRT
jgi:hypothetical protein